MKRPSWFTSVVSGLSLICLGALLPWAQANVFGLYSDSLSSSKLIDNLTLYIGLGGVAALILLKMRLLPGIIFEIIEFLVALAAGGISYYVFSMLTGLIGQFSAFTNAFMGIGLSSFVKPGIGLYMSLIGPLLLGYGTYTYHREGRPVGSAAPVSLPVTAIGSTIMHLIKRIPKKVYAGVFIVFLALYIVQSLNIFAKREKKSHSEAIKFAVQRETNANLPVGLRYIKTVGHDGQKQITEEFTYDKNEKIISTKVLGVSTVYQAVDQVVVEGSAQTEKFSQGLRERAQSFYDQYKGGKVAGGQKWLQLVTGNSTTYSDSTINDAIKDTNFSVKEITVGKPDINMPGSSSTPTDLRDIKITANLPLQVRSSSDYWREQVVDGQVTAYYDVEKGEWTFAPIGPILSAPGSETKHFDATYGYEGKTTSGLIRVAKVVHSVPLKSSSWYSGENNVWFLLDFDAKFDNGKRIEVVNFEDFRDDLGNKYSSYKADLASNKSQYDSSPVAKVWGYTEVKLADAAAAKTASAKIRSVEDKYKYSWGEDHISATLRDFTLTEIKLK